MSTFATISTAVILALFSATALCAVYRVVRGPTLLDRMIASDVLLTTLMLAVGADMVIRGHTESILLMTVIAATAAFATIIVARYVRRQADSEETDVREEEVPHVG